MKDTTKTGAEDLLYYGTKADLKQGGIDLPILRPVIELSIALKGLLPEQLKARRGN